MMRILLISGMLLAMPAFGKEQHLQCPERYPMQEVKIADVPQGWSGLGVVSAGMPLENAGAIDGPYSGLRAELRGSDRETKEGSEHIFVFAQKEKWIYCGYGGGVELLHRVAEEATQCIIKYKRVAPRDRPEIWLTCK